MHTKSKLLIISIFENVSEEMFSITEPVYRLKVDRPIIRWDSSSGQKYPRFNWACTPHRLCVFVCWSITSRR